MQNVRDRITLGIALIVAVVGGMSGSLYVAFPLLLLAIFFIFWGRAPLRTEEMIGHLPFGEDLLRALSHLDKVISPPVETAGDRERREYIDQQWPDLSADEKLALVSTIIHGRPHNVHHDTWGSLQRKQLVDGDFYGAGGIRGQYRNLIAERLREEGLIR
jgi:hypothetical protein